MPGGGMSLWLWLFLYRIIPVGLGLGSLSHKSVIPEQRWLGMPEIWREMNQVIVLSYRIDISIAFEKKGAYGVKLGERGPQKHLWTAVAQVAA